jgi:hypothetical protein
LAGYNLYRVNHLFTSHIQPVQASKNTTSLQLLWLPFLFARQECSNVTADSTDDSESSSKNNSNHSDQLGAAANMATQFDQASQQQQLQHKVCRHFIPCDVHHRISPIFLFLCICFCLVFFFVSSSSSAGSCSSLSSYHGLVPYHGFMSLASPQIKGHNSRDAHAAKLATCSYWVEEHIIQGHL